MTRNGSEFLPANKSGKISKWLKHGLYDAQASPLTSSKVTPFQFPKYGS